MISITPFLASYLIVLLAGIGLELVLIIMNIHHLKQYGDRVPEPFKGYIDPATLTKIRDYTVDNQNFDILTSGINNSLFIVIILSGILPWFSRIIQNLGFGALGSGLIFFAVLGLAEALFSLPFYYYHTFVIEQRYGYNTSTLKVWISDILKGAAVTSILGGILILLFLALIEYGGHLWWLGAWFFFLAFQVLLAIIYPTIIAPWFNKFYPLGDKVLEKKVGEIMHQNGLSVTGVFVMDASKRSRHTNAYFTGLGQSKRVILFDTLVASHTHDEIIAILAHEIGHWKQKHILKKLILMSIMSLLLFYLVARLLKWNGLYRAFGFQQAISYIGLFLVGILWGAVGRFLAPLGSVLSRHFEKEADYYAVQSLQETKHLRNALKKLAGDNLSNLHPHPLYAWFYYSHPPLLKRLGYLKVMDKAVKP